MNKDKVVIMDETIQINYETIGILEQRKLIELARTLNRTLTQEEYMLIVGIYSKAITRLEEEASKQGIEI